ncbi:MAG: WYL domain-containing protein [Candidatus Bipolaricaulis sp.]|nr:WYL domain-containing protein [Candidatus Bipolaricaulis sp.]
MRADRLLSILLFLQTRGRTTTTRLAEEFEMSRRTIMRDLFALRVAGFPVYTERGPHGGCYLHDEYRNTLTQLTGDEIATLFLSSIHKPLEDLGLSDQLRAARLKLTAALPESRRTAVSRLGQRIVIDSLPWTKRARPAGFLSVLHQAAMEDRWARVTFVRRFDVATRRRVAPYGLVAKAGAWYLVWAGEDGHVRVDAVSRIQKVLVETQRFERPADFNLDTYWQTWRREEEASRPEFDVRLRVRKDALAYVRDELGDHRGVFPLPAAPTGEWIEIDVAFSFFEEARRKLLALGGAVEVLRPASLRASVADFARQIARRYADEETCDG